MSALERFRASRWAWLEPWYDWGRWGIIRLDERGEGEVFAFQIDWLGFSLLLHFGRTPPAMCRK
jgi:hypothetical protein